MVTLACPISGPPGLASPLSSDHNSSTVTQKILRVHARSLWAQGPDIYGLGNAPLSFLPHTNFQGICLRARGHQGPPTAIVTSTDQAWLRRPHTPILSVCTCAPYTLASRASMAASLSHSFPTSRTLAATSKNASLKTPSALTIQVTGTLRGRCMSYHLHPSINITRPESVLP